MYNVHLPDFSLEEYRNGPWFQKIHQKGTLFQNIEIIQHHATQINHLVKLKRRQRKGNPGW